MRKTPNIGQENGENNEQEKTKTKKNIEILRHLSNFWRTLDIPFCETKLILTWS